MMIRAHLQNLKIDLHVGSGAFKTIGCSLRSAQAECERSRRGKGGQGGV